MATVAERYAPPARDRLLRLNAVAELIGVAPATLYSWRHRGEGPPSFKLGENVVYRESELDKWIAAQEEATRKG